MQGPNRGSDGRDGTAILWRWRAATGMCHAKSCSLASVGFLPLPLRYHPVRQER